MASACSGLFGLPITQTWFQACFKSGRPVSSALFEPTENGNDTSVHWSFSKDSKVNPDPDRRPMIICIYEGGGDVLGTMRRVQKLVSRTSFSFNLSLGWLALTSEAGFNATLASGNILRLCHDRVQSWGADTTLEEEGSEHLDKQLESFHLKSSTSVTLGTWDPKRASEVEVLYLDRFDLSACMQDYFTAARADARSLSLWMRHNLIYNHLSMTFGPSSTPPFWATLFHAQRPSMDLLPLSSQELAWRLHVRSRSADEREGAIRAIIKVQDFQRQFPPILRTMAPVLKDWHSALDQMDDVWTARQYQASTTGGVVYRTSIIWLTAGFWNLSVLSQNIGIVWLDRGETECLLLACIGAVHLAT
ncbi:hypothetical protein R3P38DRAFT_2813303 [Favolaschia claudopus]|uniref:Uncharacterized protein n=1 Tax=Favolaschia claudopus TaxID=2862362 RepID=A0AAV9Z6C7_9AGAR